MALSVHPNNLIKNYMFVDDIKTLILISSASEVSVALSVNSETSLSLDLHVPDSSHLGYLRLGDILKGIVSAPRPGLSITSAINVAIVASAGEENLPLQYTFLYGGSPDRSASEISRRWLTWRPQISRTFKDAIEVLTGLWGYARMGWDSGTYAVKVRMYFSSMAPKEVTRLIGSLPEDYTYYSFDCSPSRLNLSSDELDDLAAYDVWFELTGTVDGEEQEPVKGVPQRFVVSPNHVRVKEFFFFNSLGTYDRVFAEGDCEAQLEGEGASFTNLGIETETENAIREQWEVHSGLLMSERGKNLWKDFLRSTSRYILDEKGVYQRIVVDSYETDLKEYLPGSVSFVYRLSNPIPGHAYDDAAELEDYVVEESDLIKPVDVPDFYSYGQSSDIRAITHAEIDDIIHHE